MKCYIKTCSNEGIKSFTVFGKRLGELCADHHKKLSNSQNQPLTVLTVLIDHMDEVPPVHEPGTIMLSRHDPEEKSLIVLKSIPWERKGAWETGYKVYLYHSNNVIDIRGDILNRNWKVSNV